MQQQNSQKRSRCNGKSINRRAIVYCLCDIQEYVCSSMQRFSQTRIRFERAKHERRTCIIVSCEISDACLTSATISRACSLYFCRCFRTRDMQESYSRPPFNLPRSIRTSRETERGGSAKSLDFFFSFFDREKRCSIVLSLIAMLDCTINASDRADKSAIVAIVISSLCIHSALPAVFWSLPFGARKRDEFRETWSKARLRFIGMVTELKFMFEITLLLIVRL